MRRSIIVALVAILCLAFQIVGRAQNSPSSSVGRLRMFAAGGLLGQFDGMPEYPGGSFDTDVGAGIHPYGGIEGLLTWWRAARKPGDLLLLTANNLPQNGSDANTIRQVLERIGLLQPSVVALGTEDFLRGLASTGGAGRFVEAVRTSGLPFIVSNAAVRLHGPGLNRVADHGFELQIEPDESIGWVSELVVSYPCGRQGLRASLVLDAPQEVRIAPQSSVRTGTCRARVSLPSLLRPATQYGLDIRINGDLAASFRFRTDELLTPSAWLAPESPEQPLVVTLADPAVRSMLAASKWQWKPGDGASCAAARCEILLLPPIEAFDAAIALAEATPTGRPVALMSDLDDADTFAVLQHSVRVRFLILPPDSAALGRASARTAVSGVGGRAGGPRPAAARPGPALGVEGPYSGDLGYGAVLNMNTPPATQVWSRPEWFGETIHEMAADVNPATWALTNVTHEVHSIKGLALCATSPGRGVNYVLADWTLANGTVQYTPRSDAPVIAAVRDRYAEVAPDVAYDKAGRIAQGALWTDVNSFAAAALDAMREGLNTDLAILPDDAIDENQLVYLREDPHAPTQALSKAFLWRVLFRTGGVVKVRVAGTSLVDTVNKVLAAGRADGTKFCLSGLDAVGCNTSRLPSRDVLVNGRRLNKIRFYTIALPENVALSDNLPLYGHATRDLADLMDERFARRVEGAVATCAADYHAEASSTAGGPQESLAARLEGMKSVGSTPYLTITPAEFAFSEAVIGEPPEGQGLFNKLGLAASGTRPSERVSVNLGVDVGIYDVPRFEVRALGTVGYGRAKVNGQSSTDPNTSLAALRFDWKMKRGRLFGGANWESQFGNQVTLVTPTNKGVAGPTLPLVTLRRDYRYAGFGFESERPDITRWLSIDPLRVSIAIGTSQHEHVDVEIDGQSQGIDQFQQVGATSLLSRYFVAHPSLSATAPYVFVDRALRRNRVQFDATPRVSFPFGGKTLSVSLAASYRRFVGPNAVPLAERQSATFKATVAVPLFGVSTLNVNNSEFLGQVNGVSGWFTVWQPSVSLSIPLIANRHAGVVY